MREYILSQSESRRRGGIPVMYWWRNWLARRSFARLAQLSDYQLRDIGLTHDEAVRLSRLPLSVDPGWEAERLRLLTSRRPR